MAESNTKSGILALAQKRISRTKTKVLQNLGKAEKTTDDVFNDNVLKVEKQQEAAHRLQKELRSYTHCLREMSHASKSLAAALSEIYEPEWTKESAFKAQLQTLDLLWGDFLQNVQDSVIVPVNNYLQSFPVLRAKIAKRGRKLVDYDNSRHHLDVLLSAKKKDEVKIHKAQEEMKEAKRIYDELHNDLHTELPDFCNSRITFYASLLTSLFGAEQVFHSEVGKVDDTLGDICQELSRDFEHFVYQPKRALSKSVSSNSGENGFHDDISSSRSPSAQLARTSLSSVNSSVKELSQHVYNNQEVPDSQQEVNSSPTHHNGTNSPPQDVKVINKPSSFSGQRTGSGTSDKNKHEEDSEHKLKRQNLYDDPRGTSVTNHIEETDSEEEEEGLEPTYNNPPPERSLKSPPPNTLFIVQAVHKYTKEDIDELSLEPGDVVYVIEFDNPEEQDDGWLMGIKACDGVKGVFPENFTQRVPAEGR